MKTILSALIVSSIIGSAAQAQSKFSFGPNAGFGHSWISNVGDSKYKPYGNFGVSAVYSAAEHFGIGVDVKYSFEGGKDEGTLRDNEVDLNYVRVPVKAIYFFNNYGDKVRPKIAVGPSFGFLTNAKYNGVSVTSNYNSVDFGVTGAAGVNIRLVEKTWLNFDVSYLHGISDVRDDVSNAKYHNRNIGLNVGVNFGL